MKRWFSLLAALCLCLLAVTVPAAADDAAKPGWYPDDPANFTFFHDESAPRVVDDADIFSDAEEQRMEARLAELRAELGKDLVIYTDSSSYGMEHSVLAADFYDFNGYGCGEEREGACLLICMDPSDRGWFTCCTGSSTRALYTAANASAIDGALYDRLASGEYAAAAEGWIENFRTMCLKGLPFAPEWFPDAGTAFQRFHDPRAQRVVDDAGILDPAELAWLTTHVIELSQRSGVDFVIHTVRNTANLSEQDYMRAFYEYNGYGFGEDYDGLQLAVFCEEDGGLRCLVAGYGAGADKLSDVNRERLQDRCDGRLEAGAYYQAMDEWLDQAEHMLKTGRAPRAARSWSLTAAIGALLGSLFGGVSLGGARAKMRTPKVKTNANAYVAAGSVRIMPLRDDYLGSYSTRRYSPREERSSSSGGGSGNSGGSSYSSSYSGSSGAPHSGSGGKF